MPVINLFLWILLIEGDVAENTRIGLEQIRTRSTIIISTSTSLSQSFFDIFLSPAKQKFKINKQTRVNKYKINFNWFSSYQFNFISIWEEKNNYFNITQWLGVLLYDHSAPTDAKLLAPFAWMSPKPRLSALQCRYVIVFILSYAHLH